MKTKFILLAMATLIISTTVCAQKYQYTTKTGGFFSGNKTVKASSNYVTKEMRMDPFDQLTVAGSINVEYTQREGAPKVEIYTSDNILPVLDVKVERHTLEIAFKKGYNVHYNKLRIRVNSPRMEEISIAGSGDVKLMNGIKGEELELNIAGSGDIGGRAIICNDLELNIAGSGGIKLIDIDCNRVEADIAGSGDIKLGGKARTASFSIAGSGDIDAGGLHADKVSSDVAGSGKIHTN